MQSHLWIVVALAVAVAGCGKKEAKDDGKAGAASGEAAVRGFVEGVLAKDLDRARRFLPDDAACDGAPPEHRTPCTENGRMMRAQVDGMVDDFPAGAKIKSIKPSADASGAPELAMWDITFEGGDPAALMTVQIGKRYYAAFAIRRDR
jgi:hypothetical protein